VEDDDGVVHGVAAVDRLLTLFRTVVPTPYMLCSQVPRAAGTFGREPAAATRKATGNAPRSLTLSSYLALTSNPCLTPVHGCLVRLVSWGDQELMVHQSQHSRPNDVYSEAIADEDVEVRPLPSPLGLTAPPLTPPLHHRCSRLSFVCADDVSAASAAAGRLAAPHGHTDQGRAGRGAGEETAGATQRPALVPFESQN
jgi:hypothetical protein